MPHSGNQVDRYRFLNYADNATAFLRRILAFPNNEPYWPSPSIVKNNDPEIAYTHKDSGSWHTIYWQCSLHIARLLGRHNPGNLGDAILQDALYAMSKRHLGHGAALASTR